MTDFTKTLEQSKTRLRAALNGHYIDRNDYLSDRTRPNGKVLTDPDKLSPEMRAAYDEKCEGCMNEHCDWCKYTSCWDDLFNPLPNGFMDFALNHTQYKSKLVRNECTDDEIKDIVKKYVKLKGDGK